MKTLKILIFTLASTFVASGQVDQKPTGNVWLDTFIGPNGAVIYPQYTWAIPTSVGTFGGYGFIETAPYEEVFQNNLVNFTPSAAKWFTAHGEIGDVTAHDKGFIQLGPRINFQKVVPKLDKVMPNLFVAYLPAMVGIRTNNVLVAGASRQFPIIGNHLTAHVEFFNRTFATHSYGEVWLIGHVHSWKHLEPAVHVIRDSSRNPVYTVAAGVRISLKP